MWPHFWRSSILSSYFFQFWTLRSCVSILGMGNFRLKIHESAQCEAILVECLLQFVKCDKRLSFHDPLKPTKCCKPDRFWLVNFSKNDRSKKIRRTWGQGHVYFKLLSKYVLNGLALNNAYHRQSNRMFFSFNCEMFCCNPLIIIGSFLECLAKICMRERGSWRVPVQNSKTAFLPRSAHVDFTNRIAWKCNIKQMK